MRDRTVGGTLYILFTTRAFATGIPTTLAGTPVVSAYEDGSTTQITAGITLGVDHDGVTGLNLLTIVATGGNGYETGKDYSLVITTGTVDSVSVIGEAVGEFSLGLSAAFTRIGPNGAGLTNVNILQAAADKVWSTTTRTITGLTTAAILSIWDQATSALTTAGRIGKLLVDNINATISSRSSHTAVNVRTEMDSNSTVFATLLEGLFLQVTTIATLASQTSFTLTAGSADDDAYNGATIVVVDASTGVQKAFGSLSAYAGSTKTVTLAQDPGIFTMADGDKVYILPSDVFAIWDRILTGATHNVPTSAGRRLRLSTGIIMSDGTAQAGGVNNITLAAGESSQDDLYWQAYIAIVAGTGAGQGHHCISYDGTTKVATMDDDWTITPDATSEYIIFGSGSHDEFMSGLAQAGTANSITLISTAHAGENRIKDCWVVLISGTGAHQARLITAYNGTTKVATVYPDWVVNPDATTGYWIVPQGQNNVWDQINTGVLHNITNSTGKQLRESAAVLVIETGTAQAGAAGTLTLAAGANANNNFYDDMRIVIVGGTGVGQARVIHEYNGTTKVASIAPDWIVTPDNTSEYQIQSQSNVHVHELAAAAVAQILSDATPFAGANIALIKAVTDNQAKVVISGTAEAGTLSVTEMTTDLTITVTDQLNDRVLTFDDDTVTVDLRGQQTDITASVAAGGKLTFTAVTTAPAVGDSFKIT